MAEEVAPKKAGWPTSGSLPRSGKRKERDGFYFYFRHTSTFQNTNVLPLDSAQLQHPARCIINDQEREPGFTLAFHPQPLASQFPIATKETATSCRALWKFEGSWDSL